MLHGFKFAKLVFLSAQVFTYCKCLHFSHSPILDKNLVVRHTIKQLPRASPDLCKPLMESIVQINVQTLISSNTAGLLWSISNKSKQQYNHHCGD